MHPIWEVVFVGDIKVMLNLESDILIINIALLE